MEFLCNIPRQRCCGRSRWSADAESLEQSQGKTGGYPKCGRVYGRSERWRNHLQFFTEYPREVPHVRGLEYCVNMMHPSGSGYRWPHGQKDEIYYYESDIVKTLAAPVPSRSRGTFSFNI